MYLIKVKFDRSLGDFRNKVQNLMDEMMHLNRPVLSPSDTNWTPEADMYETENEIILIVNLGGVRKDQVAVSFYKNHLRVEGKRAHSIPPGTLARYHQLEMGHGDFERVFRVPTVIDEDKIEASYAEGLLTVRMKKRKKPHSIPVMLKP
ncbi:MAG: Hsp20/alpha crystallin family protein [Desulfobacteraceae bacterium]|nr:MAG: Hsp20/alpha crystallin family protein [Desulfobacteraceae bacterium]